MDSISSVENKDMQVASGKVEKWIGRTDSGEMEHEDRSVSQNSPFVPELKNMYFLLETVFK